MKKKWWAIPIVLAAALMIFAGLFWDTVLLHAAPKVVLGKALSNTVSLLQVRMADSPISLIAKSVDLQGNNTASLKLNTANRLLGNIQYSMNVQTNGSPRKILSEGRVISKSGALDLSVYMDENFAAVSSEILLDDHYYGITYDTFPEDIRSFPLLPILIGQTTLKSWEKNVADLQDMMDQSFEIPSYSVSDLQLVLGGILQLKPHVSKDSLTISGQKRGVYRLDFSIPGSELAAAAAQYAESMSQELRSLVDRLTHSKDSSLNASFYICEGCVVKTSLDLTADEALFQLELFAGENPAKDPVSLAMINKNDGILRKWSVDLDTEYTEKEYAEKISIVRVVNGVQDRIIVDYVWDLSTGDMQLAAEGEEDAVLLNLQQTQEGIKISTNQFEDLLRTLGVKTKEGESSCEMVISRGSDVSVPEYKNLDEWSADDLLTLLSGFGSLLGLEIE